jgi:mRNA interferase MazF
MNPRRGELWWVRLDPTEGSEIRKTRPCLILTHNIINERRRTVVVVPLSTSPNNNPPLLVSVHCAGRAAVAVTDQIRAVSKDRLIERIEELSAQDLQAVEDGVQSVLDLPLVR